MPDKLSTEGLKAAADMTKQIITLSTGVVALTITFLEKIVQTQSTGSRSVPWSLFAAWMSFGMAILLAIMTLAAVTGSLDAFDRKQNGLAINAYQQTAIDALAGGWNVRAPALGMSLFFVAGMSLTILTGFLLLK